MFGPFVCRAAKLTRIWISSSDTIHFISITAAEVYFNSIVERRTSESYGRDFFSASFLCLIFFLWLWTLFCGSNIMLNIFLLHVSRRFVCLVFVPALFVNVNKNRHLYRHVIISLYEQYFD